MCELSATMALRTFNRVMENRNVINMQSCKALKDMGKMCSAQYILEACVDVLFRWSLAMLHGLGCFAGTKRLEVNPDIVPVKMPLAVQDRPQEEVQRLESLGVIEKITEPTDGVSVLVVAEKKNGKLRVCIDPEPLNKLKALRRRTYPRQKMEDVLS